MSRKFSQTQRNFMIDQLTIVGGDKLRSKAIALTPKFFPEVKYEVHNCTDYGARGYRGFTYNIRQDSGLFTVEAGTTRAFTWAAEGVCSTRAEVRNDVLSGATRMPTKWYEEQIEAGLYEVKLKEPSKSCDMHESAEDPYGVPAVQIFYTEEDRMKSRERKKLVARCNNALNHMVENYKEWVAYCHDVEKWMNQSYRKLMLGDSDIADELLSSALDDAKNL